MARPPTADEQALLRRVIATPDDDTVRLVLADWYDEHAVNLSPPQRTAAQHRAEFIRAQIALDRLDEWDDGAIDLQIRCEELLRLHRDEWLGSLDDSFLGAEDPAWPVFRRGFPERVTLRVREFLEHRERVFRNAPVTGVRFRPSGRGGLALDYWTEADTLRSMWFDGFDQGDGLEGLAEAGAFPQLSELSITGYGGLHPLEVMGWATGMPELTSLRLDLAIPGSFPVSPLAGRFPPLLRRLHLSGDLHEGVSSALWASAAGTLTHLTVDRLQDLAGTRLVFAVAQLALHSLAVCACVLEDDGATMLAELDAVAGLAHLGLAWCQIGEAGVLAAVNSPHLAALRSLDLSGNEGGDAVLQAVGAAPLRESLRTLNLLSQTVTDRGLLALAHGPGLPNLVRLQVHVGRHPEPVRLSPRWDRTDDLDPLAVRALIESPGLPKLVSLTLTTAAGHADRVAQAIAESPAAARLRELRFHTVLTEAGVRALVESPHLADLAVLDVRLASHDPPSREMLRRRFGRRARAV